MTSMKEKSVDRKRKRSRPHKKDKKGKKSKREDKPNDSGDHRRKDGPLNRPPAEEPEFKVDFFFHYPGHAVTFPNISLILANLAQAVMSTLASGKRSDKMRISPFPQVVLASSYFQVVLMSNVARFSISRIIGIDYTYPTGEEVGSELSPLFLFVHSVNIFCFMQHFLGAAPDAWRFLQSRRLHVRFCGPQFVTWLNKM